MSLDNTQARTRGATASRTAVWFHAMLHPVPEIVLATLNARWTHSALGLRSLLANLGPDLAPRATLLEGTLAEDPVAFAERLLAAQPRVVGLGVYLWNVAPLTAAARYLRAVAPHVALVLGGPEVVDLQDLPALADLADVIITGEAERAFPAVCRTLLRGEPTPPRVQAPPPDLATLALPDAAYDDEDVAHRVIYVETSRGCPYRCAFCLSARDRRVRRFPIDAVLAALDRLYARGVRRFKFVDRALHLGRGRGRRVLEWLLSRLDQDPALFAHFELVPDRLPKDLRPLLARFPAGSLQLEVGVQSFTPAVCARIGRRQDPERVADTLAFLCQDTAVHLHADLVVGLPGETRDEIAAGFDRLLTLGPQEIQVGLLKRLRGTPLAALAEPWSLRFHPEPPYEVRATSTLDASTVADLKAFAMCWDRLHNRGHLPTALPLLWQGGRSPFHAFDRLTRWLTARTGRAYALPLKDAVAHLYDYLTTERDLPDDLVGPALLADYRRVPRKDLPACLRPFARAAPPAPSRREDGTSATPPRQRRHR